MTDEQWEIVAKEVYRLKVELDKLERTGKRGQQFNHDEQRAFKRGQIHSFQVLKLLLDIPEKNTIEQ